MASLDFTTTTQPNPKTSNNTQIPLESAVTTVADCSPHSCRRYLTPFPPPSTSRTPQSLLLFFGGSRGTQSDSWLHQNPLFVPSRTVKSKTLTLLSACHSLTSTLHHQPLSPQLLSSQIKHPPYASTFVVKLLHQTHYRAPASNISYPPH